MNWSEVFNALGETILVVLLSTALAYLVGLPLGVLLHVTKKNGLKPIFPLYRILSFLVNVLRSIPCLIVVVLCLPIVRAFFGRGTGAWYTMLVPLFFSSFAYVARVVEGALAEVDSGKIEAAKSLGASIWQTIFYVLLPEARVSLLSGLTVTAVNILGYTAFAYNIGAGGIISYIWSYYTRNTGSFLESWEFWILILVTVLLVQLIQEVGLRIVKRSDKRKAITQ